MSRGLKPGICGVFNVRDKSRTYLRSNGKGDSNSKGKNAGAETMEVSFSIERNVG
jgi:hypothetical protein